MEKSHVRNISTQLYTFNGVVIQSFMSKTITLVCVDAAFSDLNLWGDNKAQKLAPPAILCP